MPTTIPHFSLPFRFDRGRAVVREQDSDEEIMDCVAAIILCPLNFRFELPQFGIPDPAFTERQPNVSDIARAVTDWEPRAQNLVTTQRDSLDELIHFVTVSLGAFPPLPEEELNA